MIIDNPQPRCRICQHQNKAKIHELYLKIYDLKDRASWKAFLNAIEAEFPGEFGLTSGDTILMRHFRGSTVKGKVRLPHFSIGTSTVGTPVKLAINQTIAAIEERLEKKGLMVAEKVIDEISDGTRFVKNTEAINLLGKIGSRRAAKDALELKKRELDSKNKRFDKALLAALYGNPGQIKEAILVGNDNDGNAQGLLGGGEAGVLEEHHQGEE